MKKSSQSGFSAVEALLVLILLAILGFTGLYVYHAQNNANETLDTADKTAASQTQAIKKKDATATASKDTSHVEPYINDQSISITKTTYSSLPGELRTVIIAHAKSVSGCVGSDGNFHADNGGAVYDPSASYVDGKYVVVDECHAAAIYAYKGGVWNFVAITQFDYNCADLKQYSVPAALIAINGEKVECVSS